MSSSSDQTNTFMPKIMILENQSSLKKVSLFSNHYSLQLNSKEQFHEWFIRIIEKKDLEGFQLNPKSVEDAVPLDSRELFNEVYYLNRSQLRKDLGFNILSGQTLFTYGKEDLELFYFFQNHPKFVLISELKNKGIDFQHLSNSVQNWGPLKRFLNSKLKKNLKEINLIEHGMLKKFYDFKTSTTLQQHNLRIYQGYKVHSDFYQGGIKVLIDTCCKIMSEKNLWQEFLSANIQGDRKDMIENFFIGRNVVADYGNNKGYKIDGIDYDRSPMSPFNDSKFENYADYFLQKYGKKIQYTNQFLLLATNTMISYVNNKKEKKDSRIQLIPELMRASGLTDQQKSDFRIMNEVGKITIQRPQQRFQNIEKLAQQLNQEKEDQFKIFINTNTNKIQGYQLDFPQLLGQKKFQAQDRLRVDSLYKSKNLKYWLFFYDYRHQRDSSRILDNLIKAGGRYGLKTRDPIEMIEIPKNANGKYIQELVEKSSGKYYKKLQLIMFVCNKQTARSLYKDVKSYYQEKGMITQFYTGYNPNKDNLSKYSNMLLQMTQKIGGVLWTVDENYQDLIVIGVQISKTQNKGQFTPIVIGVSQYGKQLEKSYTVVESVQSEDDSVGYAVGRIVLQISRYFEKKMSKIPGKIIVYRSSVSGKKQEDFKLEISQTLKILTQQYQEQRPKMTVISVTKIMNDRFVADTPKGLQNPKGIVVADQVTESDSSNFYLVAQFVNQGTATPTHYKILFNDNQNITMEFLFKFTYNLTFTYMNWMGPVRTPAPFQYTEKLVQQLNLTKVSKLSRYLKSSLFFL